MTTDHVVDAIGREINLNMGFDAVWNMPAGKGPSRGLIVNTADGGKTAHTAIYIGRHAGTGGWLQGIHIRGGAIAGATTENPSRAMTIEGSPTATGRYAGLMFSDGYFLTGIDMSGVGSGRISGHAALTLPYQGRIRFGSTTTSRWVGPIEDAGSLISFNNFQIGINGVQVIGERQTGWGAPTGTPSKAAFATYAAPVFSAVYDQGQVQALAESCQTTSRTLAALINDLRNHGLIGD